jgi:glycerol-3-phosphate dehydrogenase
VSSYDLLVIGGGINGLGIAADASARGLSVLLVEKGDFGGATTAASSRLIHGGLRYLQYGELSLVRESLRERGLLVRQRPHLVRPIQLLIPAFSGIGPPSWKLHAGLKLYDLLARDAAFPLSHYLSRAEVQRLEPGLSPRGLQNGFVYPDGQIEFPERLCVQLMRETVAAGGEALNHTQAVSFRQQGDRVVGANLRNELTGQEWDVEARLTLNAAGPWVDAVNRLLPTPPPRLIGGTWGTHLVLPLRPEGPRGHLYATAQRDGRPFFILPWDGRLLVGTTDVPFEGDPDRLAVQAWEVEYLLAETNRLFPGAGYTEADVQLTTIGIRPLPRSDRAAGAITRRHFLVDHGRREGIPGLASVVGGKLTTYRSLAEEVVDWCCGELGRPVLPCPTRALPPEGALPEAPGLSPRSQRLYGPHAGELQDLLREVPALACPLLPGSLVTTAEVVYAARKERARTVDDVLRRRLMLLPAHSGLQAAVRRISEQWQLDLR